MKNFIYLLLIFTSISVFAQEDSQLKELLDERTELYQEFKTAREQKNSFFGLANKSSKKDLVKMVEALKKIILKDDEVLQAVRIENSMDKGELVLMNSGKNEALEDLSLEVNRLSHLVSLKEDQINELKFDLADQAGWKDSFDKLLVFYIFTIAGLIALWYFKLR